MSFKTSICALVLAMLGSVSCSSKVEILEVVAKQYEPERKWVQMVTIPREIPVSNDIITTYDVLPMFHESDEKFYVIFKIMNSNNRYINTKTILVRKELYETLNKGMEYTLKPKDEINPKPIFQRPATEPEMKELEFLEVTEEDSLCGYCPPDSE